MKHEGDDKLAILRQLMRNHKIGIYLVLQTDEHQSEYVADPDKRIKFISNFNGSSAFVSIGFEFAELATDSRYYLLAERQLNHNWTLRKQGQPGVADWQEALIERARKLKVDVGVDPRFIHSELAFSINAKLNMFNQRLVPLKTNLIDQIWVNKPGLPNVDVFEYPIELSGESTLSKLARLRAKMRDANAESLIVYSLEEIAWLLNLRGGDIPYVPVFKAFVVVTMKLVVLYTNKRKFKLRMKLPGFRVHNYDEFFPNAQYYAESKVWVPGLGPWAVEMAVSAGHPESLIRSFSPINLMRAIKNKTEINGIYSAQLKCSLSIVQYLSWLNDNIDSNLNEYDGAEKLLQFRQQLPDFMGNSFETISASGANASMPHYAPTKEENQPILKNQIYLLDSGSQFLQGSTDITRTVHFGTPTSEEIRAYTLVLKGHLAVAMCVFPEGTSGYKIDLLARQHLWEHGMDYGHGTGHGIGSYLNIHELPLGIGISIGADSNLMPGHFVSDEPGYYKDNVFGVRIESDILVKNFFKNEGRQFCKFDITTKVPFEPKLIDVNLLTSREINFINEYHRKCEAELLPYLDEREAIYLKRCTAQLIK